MSYFSKFAFISLIILFGSCSIDEVVTPEKGYLVIASDFLEAKDSVLFRNFSEQKKVVVKIKHLSTDSILSHYKQFKYNSQFDAVLLKSSYNLYRLSNAGLLNKLPAKIDVHARNINKKNTWLAIGFDPYVLDFEDSLAVDMNYSALTERKKWKPILTNNELIPFYATVIEVYGRNKMNQASDFISKMSDLQQINKKDTLKVALYSLNMFSNSHKIRNQYSFPNQTTTGAYYDCVGFGILSHSKKYIESTLLINYIVRQHNNQGIAGKMHIFPLMDPNGRADFEYQNAYPKLSTESPINTAIHIRNVQRILKKIKKNQSSSERSVSSNSPPSSSALSD